MNATTLGTWRNPPLAYVVAEIVISPYYSMGNAVPGLQDRLRIAYPRTVEAQEIVLDGSKPSAQPLWQLTSADQKHGVQISTRAISLHVTNYLHFEDFLSRWAEVLDAVGDAGLDAYVERAGLRYVDLVVPGDGHVPSDYLEEHLQGVTPEGASSTGSMWVSAFQMEDAIVNLRIASPSPKDVLLPPNFNAITLEKPKVMRDAEVRMKDQAPIGFIDTDCIKTVQSLFDAAKLTSVFNEMQMMTSRTFKTAISPLAREEWI